MVATTTATASTPARAVSWTLPRLAVVAALIGPIVLVLGFYGVNILGEVAVVGFLGVLAAFAVANAWSSNRWLQLLGGLAVAAFIGLNLAFLFPELWRPDHYPTFIVGWVGIVCALVGLVAGIAGFVDGRKHRLGAPRWGGVGAALILVGAGFAGGVMLAGVSMRLAPVAGAGSVALAPDATVSLRTHDLVFDPATIAAPADKLVRLRITNEDNELHTFTVPALGIDADVGAGKTVDVWFRAAAGSYAVHCAPHSGVGASGAREGMVASLLLT